MRRMLRGLLVARGVREMDIRSAVTLIVLLLILAVEIHAREE